MARFTLHGMWPSGPTYKAGLMLALTGTPHNYVHVDLSAGEQRTNAYLAKSRFGKVPALEDHEAGFSICESAVILQYLSQETGQFGASSEIDHLRLREWQSWAITALAHGIYRVRAARLGFFQMPDAVTDANEAEARNGLTTLDGLLQDRTWLETGAPTFADIDLYAVVAYAPQAKIDLTPYRHVARWMAAVEGLPGFKGVETLLPKESVSA